MRPARDDFDDEIRGHMALSVKERIERGEDPEAARLAALREFGNVTLTRDSMRSVWRPRWLDAVEALGRDIRFALRALQRAKGLAATMPRSSASSEPCSFVRWSIATKIDSSTSVRALPASVPGT